MDRYRFVWLNPRSKAIRDASSKIKNVHQLFTYSLLGSAGALADYLCYMILIELSVYLLISNIFSTMLGISVSYLLNSRITFSNSLKSRRSVILFFIVGFSGLLISSILISIFHTFLQFNVHISKIATFPILAIYQFCINKIWTFGKYDK